MTEEQGSSMGSRRIRIVFFYFTSLLYLRLYNLPIDDAPFLLLGL